jgi:hypothetical protein
MSRTATSPLPLAGILVLACAFIQPTKVTAQGPSTDPHAVQPERPTVATHAGTVAPGWAEIEVGGELDRYSDESRGGSAPLVLKLGLAPRLQLNVQMPVVRPPGTDTIGAGDLVVGLKWRLVDDARVVGDFAVVPLVKAPSGSSTSGTGSGTTDVGLLIISSHALGPIAMDLNAGYTRRSGDGTIAPRNATVWTASFGGPARGPIGWVAELYGFPSTSGPAGADAIVAVLLGPTFQTRTWLALDAGVIAPITGPQPRAIYAGGVWNIGRVWR